MTSKHVGARGACFFKANFGVIPNLNIPDLKKNSRNAICLIVCLVTSAVSLAQTDPAVQTADPNQPAQASPQTGQSASPVGSSPATTSATPGQKQSQEQGKGQDQKKDKQAANGATNATSGASNDRLFFALPNFLTVDKMGNVIPMTAGQKFKVVARGAFDPVQIVWYGALSGISQAEDSEPGFGQGAEGYGKRYGAYAADGTIENFFVGAILPSVLRQDPRFFPKPDGSFFDRTKYAVSRIFVTLGDNGHHEFNASEIFGAAIASAISTYSYHPNSDRTIGNTASVWGSQVGYDTITIIIKEFWPDIRRKIKKDPH